MLNPARGRAERGDREDTAPALGEREVPTPTRGLVNQSRQIRDREQSRVSNPAHSKRGQGWRGGQGPASKQRNPGSHGEAGDGSIVPRTSRQNDAEVRQVGGRSSVKLVTAQTQWRTRTHAGQKRIDMHALAYVDIHCTPRRLSSPCRKVYKRLARFDF